MTFGYGVENCLRPILLVGFSLNHRTTMIGSLSTLHNMSECIKMALLNRSSWSKCACYIHVAHQVQSSPVLEAYCCNVLQNFVQVLGKIFDGCL